MIRKVGKEYEVLSEGHPRRSFGKYRTRAQAVKRLGQVEYFKHRGKRFGPKRPK